MATATQHGYTISYVDGYTSTPHFGKEIAARCAGTYATLEEARAALKAARAAHRHGGHKPGRFDIVRGDGFRVRWA